MLRTDIFRIVYEAERSRSLALGEPALPSWDEIETDPQRLGFHRAEAINRVDYFLAHPEAGPSALYDDWRAARLAEGWTDGPKDAEALTMPLPVYEDRPAEAKFRDALAHSLVNAARPALSDQT